MPRTSTYSRISKIHYTKLVFRSMLFIASLMLCIVDPHWVEGSTAKDSVIVSIFLIVVWVSFAVEMIRRFFPNEDESAGCQKQFEKNYHPKPITSLSQEIRRILGRTQEEIKKKDFRDVVIIAVFWMILNSVIAFLYFTNIITAAVLVAISLFYAVSDIICILFWCPFQTLVMKNTCCAQCRIYNWDYAMMFTPLVLIAEPWALSLFLCSAALLVKWEIDYFRYPARFAEETNAYLSCEGCNERLCSNKASVQRMLTAKTKELAKAQAQARLQLAKRIEHVGHSIADGLEKGSLPPEHLETSREND